MFIPIKVKIRAAVFIIILLFTSFALFYFPKQEGNYLLKAYNSQVQNLANSVALGVQIALNEDNFEGVKTAMDYVKGKPDLLFSSSSFSISEREPRCSQHHSIVPRGVHWLASVKPNCST